MIITSQDVESEELIQHNFIVTPNFTNMTPQKFPDR